MRPILAVLIMSLGLAACTEVTPTTTAAASSPTATPGSEMENQGLKIVDEVVGTGPEAVNGATVSVNYTGWLASNHQQFDSSFSRNKPFDFQLGAGQVIKGWDMGVLGMKVGGKRSLTIPASLGYGSTGAGGGLIPPDATLIFDVELLEVK
jgi:FKBP-type peptidyl-prolyl cis-trans isomerase